MRDEVVVVDVQVQIKKKQQKTGSQMLIYKIWGYTVFVNPTYTFVRLNCPLYLQLFTETLF